MVAKWPRLAPTRPADLSAARETHDGSIFFAPPSTSVHAFVAACVKRAQCEHETTGHQGDWRL
jgi:hypothetical protein